MLLQRHLVFIHWLTKTKINNDIITFDIDSVLIDSDPKIYLDVNRLSNIIVTSNNIAYILFTSGSTGIPKAVSK